MSRLTGEEQGRLSQGRGQGWGPPRTQPRNNSSGPSLSLLLTGAAVIGLGLLAWNYLGPDLRRYLKIRSM